MLDPEQNVAFSDHYLSPLRSQRRDVCRDVELLDDISGTAAGLYGSDSPSHAIPKMKNEHRQTSPAAEAD
ncbi:hypothetical protein ACLK1T_04860 [Escherichia coli]